MRVTFPTHVQLVEGDVNEPEVPYVLLAYDAARHFGPLVVGVGGLQGLSMHTLGTCLLTCIGGAVRSRFYARPRPCPSCGRMPHPWDRLRFLDARSINGRLSRLLQRGCPVCGRMGVKHVLVNFGGKLALNMGNGPNQKRDSGAAV